MEREKVKILGNGMLKNITEGCINEYDKGSILNAELMKKIENMLQNGEISEKDFIEVLEKLGVPEELIPYLNMVRKSVDYFMLFFEESFETLHDSICGISFQMHTDKIGRAKQARKQFEMAANSMNPNEEFRCLLRDLNGEIVSDLYNDMMTRVGEIKKVPREGEGRKKMLFGWLKVKEIRSKLAELRETLPIYVDTVLLISRTYLYMGEIANAQLVLEDAQENIENLFPYKRPSENRMYTLTDEDDWIEMPQKYCCKLGEDLKQIELLIAANKRNA